MFKTKKIVLFILSIFLCLGLFSCRKIYTLSINLEDGGSLLSSIKYEYNKNELVSLEVSPNEGYSFEGYYIDTNLVSNEPVFQFKIINNTVIYVKFKVIRYTITYHLENATNSSSNPSTYTVNDSFNLYNPVSSNSNLEFIGWYLDSSYNEQVTNIPLGTTGNLDLYAKFETNIDYSYLFESETGIKAPPGLIEYNSDLSEFNEFLNIPIEYYAYGLTNETDFASWISKVHGLSSLPIYGSLKNAIISLLEAESGLDLPSDLDFEVYLLNYGTGPITIFFGDNFLSQLAEIVTNLPESDEYDLETINLILDYLENYIEENNQDNFYLILSIDILSLF